MKNGKSVRERGARGAGSVALQEAPPLCDWGAVGEREHLVQFYESDVSLLDSLSGFIGAGLGAGEGCVVVARESHRLGLEERLRATGLDVDGARARGQYVPLDSAELLTRFMADGSPEPARFAEVAGSVIRRAAEGHARVRVYGDMVSRLCGEGNHAAATRLEVLWNELGKTHAFSLFCAYPLSDFGGSAHAAHLDDVCATHARVIPCESYTAIGDHDERLRAVALLQQKADSLQAEIAERRQTEETLRVVKEELELQIEDLRRLHEMSERLTGTLEVESVLREVLRAAMSVQGTDMGLLSLWDDERGGLDLKVHSGFDEEFVRQVEWVPPGAGACGACYERRRRVVVEDVETEPVFELYREAARAAGFRACHSTPLITRGGQIIGVLSVHFRERHRPSERETRLLDLYARMAADSIENARLHLRVRQELEERERLLAGEQMARAQAESANRLKDEFLATVSHELRTPLNAIMGWAHMLRSRSLDEATVARALETIERNAQSQAQLVEDILDVSRVITGKLSLDIRPVDLASVVNAAIDSVQLAADSKGIRLEVTLDPSARHVSGDPGRLQQVIWNLLSNAIKFTPKGGGVRIRMKRAGRDVRIEVSDTGEGIRPDFLPFIFDRFRQADATSTRRHGGLGLGLAIVRHLVELHGGTVRADSEGEGLGATFTISLPLAPAERGRAKGRGRKEAAPAAWRPAPARAEALPSLEGVRVLVVDDDPDTLNMLGVALSEYRASVQTAASAAEALEVMRWHRPDVLVSDLAMPGEDGYSLIGKVRALEAAGGRRTPAVALTAYVRVEDRARALAAGFNMFVPKPVESNELVTAIANLAEEQRTNY